MRTFPRFVGRSKNRQKNAARKSRSGGLGGIPIGGKALATSVSLQAHLASELASIAVDRSISSEASSVPVLRRYYMALYLKRKMQSQGYA
jgi:hypothetical protein